MQYGPPFNKPDSHDTFVVTEVVFLAEGGERLIVIAGNMRVRGAHGDGPTLGTVVLASLHRNTSRTGRWD